MTVLCIFFFNDTATTEIYTLSLHDALPICLGFSKVTEPGPLNWLQMMLAGARSEEHTSELQSQSNLVCRLLLEKKKTTRENGDDGDGGRCKKPGDGALLRTGYHSGCLCVL